MSALIALTTCPNVEIATELARDIVHHRLAACVNIVPQIHSIYRWQDAIEESKEVLLLIKTLDTSYAALEELIVRQHPYQVPEIVTIPIEKCSEACLQWLTDCCKFPG